MRFAIFIRPNESLKIAISDWKKKVNLSLKNQPYTNHPPHLTLIRFNTKNLNKAIALIKDSLIRVKPFEIKINNSDVFFNDILTGGHTLFFKVNRDKQITKLQKVIAKNLSSSIIHESKSECLLEGRFLESFRQFGWPFVGEHWIPHFSIASLLTNKDHHLVTEFLSNNKNYILKVNQISIWEIKSDDHLLIETIKLK